MPGDEREQQTDDLVLHETQAFRAAPSMPVLDQQALGDGAPLAQRELEPARKRHSQLARVGGVAAG